MNSLRVARSAFTAALRPTATRAIVAPIQRRTYAEAADSTKLKFSLSLPHQAIYKSQNVTQVNLAAESGDMGVLANHTPVIEQLKPGLLSVVEEGGSTKQFFLAGGFAYVLPNNHMDIAAIEGAPLEDFSPEAVRSLLAEAQKIASGSGNEKDVAEAKIEVEVLESLQAALK